MNQKSEFRELTPIEHWSASISLDGVSQREFDCALNYVILCTGQNFLGFIDRERNMYIRSRYPRKKYGIPSIEECRESMSLLGNVLHKTVTEKKERDKLCFRIVLGLVEGYGEQNTCHSIDLVRNSLPSSLNIRKGKIYSAGFLYNSDYAVYKEPAAIIEGPCDAIMSVYRLAVELNQERFTVDEFFSFVSFTVETRHCRHPDL